MIKKCFILMVVLLLPSYSYGEMDVFAKKYLNKMESKAAAVFVSQCGVKSNGNYSAILLFESGSTEGLLIEMKDKIVINLATVKVGHKGLIIEETHGGVYTYDRVKKLVDELAGYKFNLLVPLKVKTLQSIKPSDTCINAP